MTEQNTTFAVGIACTIIGGVFLLMPWLMAGIVAVIVGLGLLLTGGSCLATWFVLRKIGAGNTALYVAIAAFVMALICIICPMTGFGTINGLVSICIMGMGLCIILNMVIANNQPLSTRIAKGVTGALIMVLGIASLANPDLICQLSGFALLVYGVANIILAKVRDQGPKGPKGPYGNIEGSVVPTNADGSIQASIESVSDVDPRESQR